MLNPMDRLTGVLMATVVAILLPWTFGCRATPENDAAAQHSSQVTVEPRPSGGVLLRLDPASAEHLFLQTAPVEAVTITPSSEAYARVIDASTLVDLLAAEQRARADFDVASGELGRLRQLVKGENVTGRALDAAAATQKQSEAEWHAARSRLALTWGPELSERSDIAQIVQDIAARRRALVRIDLIPAEERPPKAVTLSALHKPSRQIPAAIVGRAPTSSEQFQGLGFFAIAEVESVNVPQGAALIAHVDFDGAPVVGYDISTSAVVRHSGKDWVYVRTASSEFERRSVEILRTDRDHCSVAGPLSSGDEVVTSGAQALLSSESLGDASAD